MIYVIALIRAEKLLQPFALKAYQTAAPSDIKTIESLLK